MYDAVLITNIVKNIKYAATAVPIMYVIASINTSCLLDSTNNATMIITGTTINKYLCMKVVSIPMNLDATIALTESIPLNWKPPNPNTDNATKHTAYTIPNFGLIKYDIYSFGVFPIILEFNVSE